MEQAIKKAIEGGYSPAKHRQVVVYRPNAKYNGIYSTVRASLTENDIFIDPLFWQALGKAEGWKSSKMMRVALGEVKCEKCGNDKIEIRISEVKNHWYAFIDHLAEGKPADEFFKELLK